MLNILPHGYEWRFHGKPGHPGSRWVKCRKRSHGRLGRIELQEYQRNKKRRIAEAPAQAE